MDRNETIKTGIMFGAALAITILRSVNTSILGATVSGLLSWVYVIDSAILWSFYSPSIIRCNRSGVMGSSVTSQPVA